METEIQEIKNQLLQIGQMHPGSISQQYNVCGNPSCRCKDLKNPQKHGPYYQLSYVHRGKHTTRFIKKEDLDTVREQIANYRIFRKLTQQWLSLALKLAKESLPSSQSLKP